MAVNRIILNETSYFGAGARRMLADEFRGRGYVRAFVVTDKDLIRFGVAGKVTGVLDEAGIAYEIFSDLKPNPTVKNVQAGVEAFRRSGADAIVAIGGGSAMDTAKAVGIIAANPAFGDVVSLEGTAPTANRSVPIFALPTTAGTAAEVTINYVITDEANTKKMVCVDPKDIPTVAIIDAELMAAMPRGLTAATGMDALTHAIEGYITKGAWTLTDMFELKAVELIARWLPAAVENGADTEAREGMAVAQYIAGMGFSNVGLGLVHGMAHPLGAFYDIPHGVANALLLPYVMQYNMESSLVKFGDVARAMGVDTAGMDTRQAAQAAVDAVRTLAVRVGIPQRLSSLGVREEDLPRLAASALADVCTPGNPRDMSAEEILALYREAF
ncbi:lactaldehyde reductase [Alistipes finegoldii]|uniref:Lactaldehyde reductase n=1 Tax=Alistipes finegoldii TaxID=214856 RepID=A0AA37KU20_9BACT|nr:lactaldehyde reductase [Alistipes finegoldii]BDF63876.1 lactaldehyde reductase [Alistipes finegoldii]GKI20223.1 lactaldehyde reductase [Alistipes finegoldii]